MTGGGLVPSRLLKSDSICSMSSRMAADMTEDVDIALRMESSFSRGSVVAAVVVAVLTCLPARNDGVEGRGMDGAEGWVTAISAVPASTARATSESPLVIATTSASTDPEVAAPCVNVVDEVCPPNVVVALSLMSKDVDPNGFDSKCVDKEVEPNALKFVRMLVPALPKLLMLLLLLLIAKEVVALSLVLLGWSVCMGPVEGASNDDEPKGVD